MKIMERHLPSFVVLVDQIPVWGPPEAKNGGAGPTDPCLPTHRENFDAKSRRRKEVQTNEQMNGMSKTIYSSA